MGNYNKVRQLMEDKDEIKDSVSGFFDDIKASNKKAKAKTPIKAKNNVKEAKNSQKNERKAPRKLNNKENRSEIIHIRITPKEYEKLTEKAIKEEANTISEYLYKLIKRSI